MNEPRIDLPISDMPRQWYNLAADLPQPPPPPLGPDGNPIGPDDLAPVFPMNLIEQEVITERWIDIPEGILEIYARWRPSPLRRAYALEKHLGTPAKIFYKDESVSPAGSHKPNTAVAQAWYNKEFGIIPAPETSHAIAAVINEAKRAKEEGKEKTILFNYSGHGLMDLAGYQAFFAGELENYPLPPEVMERSIAVMEGLPKPE